MSDDKRSSHEELAERLANHTGVTVEQARELIKNSGRRLVISGARGDGTSTSQTLTL